MPQTPDDTPVAEMSFEAAMAELEQVVAKLERGDALQPLWHWLYFLQSARLGALGRDGHPAKGGFLPPVGPPPSFEPECFLVRGGRSESGWVFFWSNRDICRRWPLTQTLFRCLKIAPRAAHNICVIY